MQQRKEELQVSCTNLKQEDMSHATYHVYGKLSALTPMLAVHKGHNHRESYNNSTTSVSRNKAIQIHCMFSSAIMSEKMGDVFMCYNPTDGDHDAG